MNDKKKIKDWTLVQLKKKTAKKLKEMKITRLDTYDEIVNRLIENQKGAM